MPTIQDVIFEMITYYAGNPKRIQHFLKVHSFAKLIGEGEGLDAAAQEILEVAAVVHDIGIKSSEEKYHSSAGKYQELEGPPIAESMLARMEYPPSVVERVGWLVGHHHTYKEIQEIDHQILVEADFLVNIYEDGLDLSSIRDINDRVFKTRTGKRLLSTMYIKNG